MTAFVILAAGRGSRIGRIGTDLHKSLVPLEHRAVLSHLIDLAPPDARIAICVGNRAQQVRDYANLAHPNRAITFIDVPTWDAPGGGPGHSLAQASAFVGHDDMVFTSCDTLWERDDTLWAGNGSWIATAPMPVGSDVARWCRVATGDSDVVTEVLDKTNRRDDVQTAYTGLARIAKIDLPLFWAGIGSGALVQNELQVTGGLAALTSLGVLSARRIDWTDVGDADAYRRAVVLREGYDWTKVGEATWLSPESGRVVKYSHDRASLAAKAARAIVNPDAMPEILEHRREMLAYEYAAGRTLYDRFEVPRVKHLIDWLNATLWRPVAAPQHRRVAAARAFYVDKTLSRVSQIANEEVRRTALMCVEQVNWHPIINGVQPVRWHGDLNFGNVIYDRTNDKFTAIDWRADFGGEVEWGDRRYDVAKLLIGCRLNWDAIRHGDFAPWPSGRWYERKVSTLTRPDRATEHIAVLALLNSAPMHADPLPEVLVAHAADWLEHLRD